MVAKIDRTGEVNYNNFGSKMIIIEYRKAIDIDIYFPKYNWTAENVQYGNFKKGNVACPYERSIYGVGYLGEGKYKIWENGKQTKCYKVWCSMLQRCYDSKYKEKHLTYIDCEVCEEWLCFQNFAEWYYNNYYEVEGERMHLDKDILVKGNKIYSPDNCIFVPERINTLFTKCNKSRGNYLIGTSLFFNGKYVAHCSLIDPKTGKSKYKHLGYYTTQQEAFNVYKQFKEKNIKQVAEYYKDQIPQKLYNAMYNYKVEITD